MQETSSSLEVSHQSVNEQQHIVYPSFKQQDIKSDIGIVGEMEPMISLDSSFVESDLNNSSLINPLTEIDFLHSVEEFYPDHQINSGNTSRASSPPIGPSFSFIQNNSVTLPGIDQRFEPLEPVPSSSRQSRSVEPRVPRTEKIVVDESDSDTVEFGMHVNLMQTDGNKRSHSTEVKQFLIRWLLRYKDNPYPSQRIKNRLSRVCGLSVTQIEDFFVNGIDGH